MGMTIDEVRIALEKERKYALHENKQAFDIAMDIMRKYQKICEIVDKWKVDTWTDGVSYDCMVKLKEVVEDGNN